MSKRPVIYGLAAAALTVSACASQATGADRATNTDASGGGSSTASSVAGAATTAPATAPAGSTSAGQVHGSAPTAATTPADPARALALRACTTWKISTSQSAAEGSGTMDKAAADARAAARSTTRWSQLSKDMSFLASLPETDNTDADVAKAQVAVKRVSTTCAGIGVPGIQS